MNQIEIEALRTQANPEAARHLRDLAETTNSKETRKAARRALFLLAQKGIVPAPAEADNANSSVTASLPSFRSWASAFDGAGNRLLFFALPDPDGGWPTLLQILFSDEEGVKDYTPHRMARRDLDERVTRFLDQLDGGLALAEIEPDAARRLLHEAHELNRRLRRPSPAGLLDILPRLGEPASVTSPAALSEAAASDTAAEVTPADSLDVPHDPVALFELPWFQPWFLPAEAANKWAFQIAMLAKGGIMPLTDDERVSAENSVREATQTLLTPPVRARYADRLTATADILRRRDRIREAQMAEYHARDLQSDHAVELVPFAVLLVTRTIGAALEMMQLENPLAPHGPAPRETEEHEIEEPESEF